VKRRGFYAALQVPNAARRVFAVSLAIVAAQLLAVAAPSLAAAQAPASAAAAQGAPAGSPPASPTSPDVGLPFSAHYTADWKAINVGTSDLKLEQDTEPGHYVYTWTITARGIFRLYRAEVTQKSWLSINAGHARPEKYHAEDGSSSVNLDFDWSAKRARGTSENKPVDLALKDGTQDVMSIQVEVMLDLKSGNLPKTFQILDNDEIKEFTYTQEGTAKIKTAMGELDTVIVSSQRTGNNRILRMWFAPSLGFAPVQAERTRDGKLEFAMRIKSLNR
jgi:Protein of unknown function (DUF3108)